MLRIYAAIAETGGKAHEISAEERGEVPGRKKEQQKDRKSLEVAATREDRIARLGERPQAPSIQRQAEEPNTGFGHHKENFQQSVIQSSSRVD